VGLGAYIYMYFKNGTYSGYWNNINAIMWSEYVVSNKWLLKLDLVNCVFIRPVVFNNHKNLFLQLPLFFADVDKKMETLCL
jgi:hypothetical protein